MPLNQPEAAHGPDRRGQDIGHPIAIGSFAVILRLDNPPYCEGTAVVRAIVPGNHRYLVQFLHEPAVTERIIRPEFQRDPAGVLAALLDLWRAEQTLRASFDNFFPPAASDA